MYKGVTRGGDHEGYEEEYKVYKRDMESNRFSPKIIRFFSDRTSRRENGMGPEKMYEENRDLNNGGEEEYKVVGH